MKGAQAKKHAEKQIPCGDDRKKGKSNSRSKNNSGSFAALRMTSSLLGAVEKHAEKQIPCGDDRKKGKSNSRSKNNSGSFAALRMTSSSVAAVKRMRSDFEAGSGSGA